MKVVLVTGAGGGIGKAMVEAFHEGGYYVIGSDLACNRVTCDAFLACDLAEVAVDASAGEQFAAALEQALDGRPLSALVNNAAAQILGRTPDISLDSFRRSLDINLVAPFRLSQLALRFLEPGGCVLNIGSVHATATKPGFVSYATSKATIHGLTRALAVDLGPQCRVICLAPAATATEMLVAGFKDNPAGLTQLGAVHPLNRVANPEEIARMAVSLASEAHFCTGTTIYADGGILSRLHDPE
ncbi:SDR family NAD(P)-dependent oxidoreductase [Dactylosporangium matsuzakiense]|uniref:Oxidoreductase n=1 Tax=Dactylosporangium matsuzakiense TaxID=53360 RepID=A0A9W6NTW5_9ACTN|nr:oxidoreductase [Dactylosporangium matsuzakiense]